jgi:hypothetical protein
MLNQGIVPKHQNPDNQCTTHMKLAMESTTLSDGSVLKMRYKVVPLEDHQRNLAKKLIGTFKDHLIKVLSGCAKSMPMHLWCQLLPQVERQLLLSQQSQVNPGMSAYAHVYQGQHDYNKHPFVPIGMESLVHIKPHKQQTYTQHCNKGYVIGTSFEHYQCQKVWMKDMHATRVSGAVWFRHKYLTNPSVTPEDQIVAAICGLAKTLTTRVPPQLRGNTVGKFCKLQEILEPRMDENDERNITTPTQQMPNHQDWRKVPTTTQQQFQGWHGNMPCFQECWKGQVWILRTGHHHSNPPVHGN